MSAPLQQTTLWQTFLTDLGETTFFHTEDTFTYLAILKTTPFGNYLYCPYGPHATTKTALKTALQALQTLAISKHAIFIRIEPKGPKNALDSLKIPHSRTKKPLKLQKTLDLSPAHTLLLDLSPTPEQLIANFSSTTRNRFNTTKKRGITITTSKNPADLSHLIKFQAGIAKHRHFHAFSQKHLETELKQPFATLYLAHFEGQVVGSSLFFDHQDTRFYMQSGTDMNPKFKNLSANVSLLGQAILDAKAQGLKFFDFWGIAPENAPPDHPWTGFTKFKKTFGGQPVAYLGTHDLILSPLKYRAYTLFRKLNRLFRRLT